MDLKLSYTLSMFSGGGWGLHFIPTQIQFGLIQIREVRRQIHYGSTAQKALLLDVIVVHYMYNALWVFMV